MRKALLLYLRPLSVWLKAVARILWQSVPTLETFTGICTLIRSFRFEKKIPQPCLQPSWSALALRSQPASVMIGSRKRQSVIRVSFRDGRRRLWSRWCLQKWRGTNRSGSYRYRCPARSRNRPVKALCFHWLPPKSAGRVRTVPSCMLVVMMCI